VRTIVWTLLAIMFTMSTVYGLKTWVWHLDWPVAPVGIGLPPGAVGHDGGEDHNRPASSRYAR